MQKILTFARIAFSRSGYRMQLKIQQRSVKISVFQVAPAIRGVNYRLVNLNKLLVAIGETRIE